VPPSITNFAIQIPLRLFAAFYAARLTSRRTATST
jgi:hypothetical protein